MDAFMQAARRLSRRYRPGLWIGAIRMAFDASVVETAEAVELRPPHYLVAVWEPPGWTARPDRPAGQAVVEAPGTEDAAEAWRPLLPRWPQVAAIAAPDSRGALLELMRHVPEGERVWLTDEAVDWRLVAAIVLESDRHLEAYHREGLEGFIRACDEGDLERIRAEYSDRDPGFERWRLGLLGGGGAGGEDGQDPAT